MFIAAKLLAFATQPLAWVLLLLGLGLICLSYLQRWRKTGIRLCWGALLVLLLTGWQYPAEGLLRQLEKVYPGQNYKAALTPYVGVIVLGGALERAELWASPGQVSLKSEAERMTVPVGLMQRNPHLKLLFTGGEGDWRLTALTEADRAKIFFDSMGVDASRVVYESKSRTTYENAIFSAQVPGVDKHLPWLLLTTAAHMPRSMGVFQKAGWNVTPYPVDYRTAETTDLLSYSLELGAQKWHYALHEIAGYWAYKLAGRL